MANNIKEAGNAMRRELGKLCEMQIADGMWASARKSDAACTAWDKALSELSQGERVFTESEVRAYGDDLLSAHMSPGQIVDRADDYEEPLYRWIDRAIKAVNAKHGLSDPA